MLQPSTIVDFPAPIALLLHLWRLGIILFDLVIVAYLEHTCAYWNLLTHDDALSDTLDRVFLALNRRVVKVVGRHLKACQHQHRIFHLLDAKTCDAQYLSLVGHFVGEEGDVSPVHFNAILRNRELYLLDDAASSCFDTQDFGSFQDVVSRGLAEVDAGRAHHL